LVSLGESISSQFFFSGLLGSITQTADSDDCPGKCVHTLAALICDEVLEQVACPSSSMRCCVEKRPKRKPQPPKRKQRPQEDEAEDEDEEDEEEEERRTTTTTEKPRRRRPPPRRTTTEATTTTNRVNCRYCFLNKVGDEN
jgi:hypothetical protein